MFSHKSIIDKGLRPSVKKPTAANKMFQEDQESQHSSDRQVSNDSQEIKKIVEDEDFVQPDSDEEKKFMREQHYLSKSSASVKVSEILGIVFGGLSSRFWLFRKHINCMPREKSIKESSYPFFAWECITLHLKHRDVDLVIRC